MKFAKGLCTAAMAGALVLGGLGAAQAQITVLLTNDDGIDALGIQAMYDELQLVTGINLVVVAPCTEASGSGFGFTTDFGGILNVDSAAVLEDGVSTGHCVEGSPGDQVRFALDQLIPANQRSTMIVVSGSNRGQNYGVGLLASGTIGAAGTANFLGVKRSIAVSQGLSLGQGLLGTDIAEFEAGAKFVANLVQALVDESTTVKRFQKTFDKGGFLNINIPAGAIVGASAPKKLAPTAIVTDYTAGVAAGTVTPYTIGFNLDTVSTDGVIASAQSTKTDVGAVAAGLISVQSLFIQRLPKGGGKVDESLLEGVIP